MKTRRLLPMLLLVLTIPAPPVIVQTTSPQYLGQMPSWERIKGQIKGNDAMETAARQMGACWQLRQVTYDLAWATQRRSRDRLTPDETRLVSDYDTGYFLASQPDCQPIGYQTQSKQRESTFRRCFCVLGFG